MEEVTVLQVPIPTAKFRRFKAICVEAGRTMREVTEELIDRQIEEVQAERGLHADAN